MGAVAVFEHHVAVFRRVWRGSVLSSFVLPVLFLLGMGYTVGHYVDARSSVLGVPYVAYIAPGVLASTALQVAFGESSWPVLSGFRYHRIYHAMRASSLRVGDILAGHLSFVLIRVGASCAAFLLVMVCFGTVHSLWALAVVPVTLLIGLAVAAPVFAYSAAIVTDGLFAVLLRFGVIPMTLFAGVFFPVEQLPPAARWLAYVSPLWHGVELCRSATLGVPTDIALHVGALAVWSTAGVLLARHMFQRRLTD